MPLFRAPWPKPVADAPRDPEQIRATDLLNAAMSYARLILRRYGQLAPFAFAIDREGQIARETLDIPRLPRDPERLYKLLSEHLANRIRRGMIEGVAVCANVALTSASAEGYTDAVDLVIEQQSGYALQVTVPYRIYGGQLHNLLPRRVTLGKHVVDETTPHLFRHAH